MSTARRFAIAFAAIFAAFTGANLVHLLRPVTCWDCFFPYGIPFTFYQAGGEGGGAGVVWRGLAGDIGVVVTAALLIGKGWNALATRGHLR